MFLEFIYGCVRGIELVIMNFFVLYLEVSILKNFIREGF